MPPSHDNRLHAALFISIAMLVAVTCDATVKHLSSTYSIHQINGIRFFVTMPFGILYMLREGIGKTGIFASAILHKQAPLMFLRGLLIATGNFCFMLAVATISLADGVAIYFTMPFFVAGIVPFLIGEKVPMHRWIAIMVGFIGVIVMTRPGSSVFEPAALFALACAFFYGTGQVMTRKLDRDVKPSITAFWQALVYFLFYVVLAAIFGTGEFAGSGNKSVDFLTRGWLMPTQTDLLLILSAGLLSALLLPLAVQAYRLAESSFVAPFEYTSMIWAVMWGIIVFGDRPDVYTIAGAAIVILAGIVMLHFNRLKRA